MKYKFRAEVPQDVEQFKQKAGQAISNIEVKRWGEGYPDVDVTFDSDLELSDIIQLMRSINDWHVMRQTVQPIEQYTGERNYDLH